MTSHTIPNYDVVYDLVYDVVYDVIYDVVYDVVYDFVYNVVFYNRVNSIFVRKVVFSLSF